MTSKVLASLPLPVAGLMSDQPVETVRQQMDKMITAARRSGGHPHRPLYDTWDFWPFRSSPT